VDVSSHFGKLHLSGEDCDSDYDASSDDDDGVVDPSKALSVQFTERKHRIDALIGADTAEGTESTSEFDEEVLSWLPVLWHLGVEGATNIGEILAAVQLCATISPRCSSSLNCSIVNIKKTSVYSNTGSVLEHVGWIRRELLLKKASSGDISRVLPVLSELQSDDLQRIVRWLPVSTQVDDKTVEGLHLAHWPEVVRKMAAHLRGLVEGVLRKKGATLAGKHRSHEQVDAYAWAGDGDLSL